MFNFKIIGVDLLLSQSQVIRYQLKQFSGSCLIQEMIDSGSALKAYILSEDHKISIHEKIDDSILPQQHNDLLKVLTTGKIIIKYNTNHIIVLSKIPGNNKMVEMRTGRFHEDLDGVPCLALSADTYQDIYDQNDYQAVKESIFEHINYFYPEEKAPVSAKQQKESDSSDSIEVELPAAKAKKKKKNKKDFQLPAIIKNQPQLPPMPLELHLPH
ncbi:MAG: hypothetical protein ABIH39_03555 [Candidatus Margulisiibacteriota bacterium]